MRPVDADAIYNKALENRRRGEIEDWEFDSIINYLDGAPTINAAEIVYCKDCKYVIFTEHRDYLRCTKHVAFSFRPNDFCSYGEYQTNTGGSNNVDD